MRSRASLVVTAAVLLSTAAPASTLYSNLLATPGTSGAATSNDVSRRFAKPFRVSVSDTALSALVWAVASAPGTTATFSFELRESAGTVPGVLVARGTATVSDSATEPRRITFDAPVALQAGRVYWAVFAVVAGSAPATWRNASTNFEVEGSSLWSSNSGASWAPLTPGFELSLALSTRSANLSPTAGADALTGALEDRTFTLAAPGVLSNDTDPDGDGLVPVLVRAPARGTLTLEASGRLTYVPAANDFGEVSFEYAVFDGEAVSAPVTATLAVAPVNDAPSFTRGADLTAREDSGPQAFPGWASAMRTGPDNEASQAVTFWVTTSNPGLFAALPSVTPQGEFRFLTAPDASGSAIVRVWVTDSGGTENGGANISNTQTFILTVEAVNDAPRLTRGPDVQVAEDSGPQTVDHWLSAWAAGPENEFGQAVSVRVTAADPQLFTQQPAIDLQTGALTYATAPDTFGTALVTLVLSDDGGLERGGVDSTTELFFIVITPVNDPPRFVRGPNVSVREDSSELVHPGWASALSVGPSNEATQALGFVVPTPDAARPLFLEPPSIDAQGTLRFTPAPNAAGEVRLQVFAIDDAGGSSPAQEFVVQVTQVNDPPDFRPGADVTVSENGGPQALAGWASAITAGPFEQQALTFTVVAAEPHLFAVQPALSPTGTLTFTPAPDAVGTSAVTILLRDDGGSALGGVDLSSPRTFSITLTPVNRPPTFLPGQDVVVLEDAPPVLLAWALDISAGHAREAHQALHFELVVEQPSLFSAGPTLRADGALAFTPAPNASGTSMVTVALVDDGGGDDRSGLQRFTVRIDPVNDAPAFFAGEDVAVPAGTGEVVRAGWATFIVPGPSDEHLQAVAFSLEVDNEALFAERPRLSPGGTLSFTPAKDAVGTAQVDVTLVDNGGVEHGGVDSSVARRFVITVHEADAGVAEPADAGVLERADAGAEGPPVSVVAAQVIDGPAAGCGCSGFDGGSALAVLLAVLSLRRARQQTPRA